MIARAFAISVLLSSCISPMATQMPPESAPYGPGPAVYPGVAPYPSAPAPQGDEYADGYAIGTQDRSYGYPRDPRRAFQRFGKGNERSFGEGYVDGHDGRPPQR